MPKLPVRLSLASLAALLLETNRKLDLVIDAQNKNHVVTELLQKHQTITRGDEMWRNRHQSRALLWAGILVPSLASIAGVILAIVLSSR